MLSPQASLREYDAGGEKGKGSRPADPAKGHCNRSIRTLDKQQNALRQVAYLRCGR